MRQASNVALLLAGGVFLVFIINVIVGSIEGFGFLSDVSEMLTLFLACVLFVIAVLARERSEELTAVPQKERDN